MANEYVYVDATGVVVPDTGALKSGIEQEYRDVFGADLVVTANTPQGVLITAETLARDAVVRNNAAVANQINPDIAGGVFLDAIGALTAFSRSAAAASVLRAVNVAGQPSTVIPEGSIAKTGAGVQFASAAEVTLDASGLGAVDFVALVTGPEAVAALALNTVVSAVLGWETVSNPTAVQPGDIGRLEESDIAYRRRRRNTLALQGAGIAEAVQSHLYDVEGVKSLSFRENVTGAPETIDGVLMGAHSIYVCVDGGTDEDVAAALLDAKNGGAGWNTGPGVPTTVNVTDPYSGQIYPVMFDRPEDVPVMARVTARVVGATGDPATLIRSAILSFAAGLLEGEAGFVVAASVSPFELAGAVNIQSPGIYVQKLEVATVAGGVYAVDEIPLDIWQKASILEGGITVIIL